jgi:quercetin dioxygenase-like cupin family protein
MTNLEKLQRLTEQLLINRASREESTVTQDTMNVENAEMHGLLNRPNKVAVSDMVMAENTDFPTHAHYEYEVMILYYGQMIVYNHRNEATRYSAPASVIFEPHEEHHLIFPQKTGMIVVSIPPIAKWPEGPK